MERRVLVAALGVDRQPHDPPCPAFLVRERGAHGDHGEGQCGDNGESFEQCRHALPLYLAMARAFFCPACGAALLAFALQMGTLRLCRPRFAVALGARPVRGVCASAVRAGFDRGSRRSCRRPAPRQRELAPPRANARGPGAQARTWADHDCGARSPGRRRGSRSPHKRAARNGSPTAASFPFTRWIPATPMRCRSPRPRRRAGRWSCRKNGSPELNDERLWADSSGFAAEDSSKSYRLVGQNLVKLTEPGKVKGPDRAPTGRRGRTLKARYASALELYRAAAYAEAEVAFEELAHDFPRSDYADNAYYWMGEAGLRPRSTSPTRSPPLRRSSSATAGGTRPRTRS